MGTPNGQRKQENGTSANKKKTATQKWIQSRREVLCFTITKLRKMGLPKPSGAHTFWYMMQIPDMKVQDLMIALLC